MFSELTQKLNQFIEIGTPGNDCIVYHEGECVYRHYAGYSDKENKIKMNGKEFYNIYSCSKPITCVAALQLYEKGLFKLEDKLSKYMPEFETMYIETEEGNKLAENSITVKDLFCMTSGFSYHSDPATEPCRKATDGKCQTREFMKYLAKMPLAFEPGTKWMYGLSHDILAALVEVISGVRFGEYVRKNIFEPLGMINSTFLLDDAEVDKLCAQYKGENADRIEKTIFSFKFGTEYESGGAGCISTVEDYIKFLEGLRTYKLLKPETVDIMVKNQLDDNQLKEYGLVEYGYGLGVRCPKDETKTDFGWGGAAGSYLLIDRENAITAFYAQHVLDSPVSSMKYEIGSIIQKIIKQDSCESNC